jgi:hypothetical protein
MDLRQALAKLNSWYAADRWLYQLLLFGAGGSRATGLDVS